MRDPINVLAANDEFYVAMRRGDAVAWCEAAKLLTHLSRVGMAHAGVRSVRSVTGVASVARDAGATPVHVTAGGRSAAA